MHAHALRLIAQVSQLPAAISCLASSNHGSKPQCPDPQTCEMRSEICENSICSSRCLGRRALGRLWIFLDRV